MAGLGTQQPLFESRLDVVFQSAVERMGLAGGGHLAAEQHHHPARLIDGQPRSHRHSSSDPFERVGHPVVGTRNFCFDFHPDLCGDSPGKVVFV